MRRRFKAIILLLMNACVPATTDRVESDAAPLLPDARSDPNLRPLDPCVPLLNQDAIPAIDAWIPEGTCVKVLCPEGAGEWRLMLCKKPDGEAEIYWEIP